MTVSKPKEPWDEAVTAAINILDAGDKLDELLGVLAMVASTGGDPGRVRVAAADVSAQIVYIRRRLVVLEAEVTRLLAEETG